MEEYQKNKEDYLRISSETRNKLTTLSATLVAAIYFYSKESGELGELSYKVSLFFLVLTIFGEILAGHLKSQHYSLWFDKQIKTIDYRESAWGKAAEATFWAVPITFLIGASFFFIAIFST